MKEEPPEHAGLPRLITVFLWILIGLGVAEVIASILGMALTRTIELWPGLIIGLGDTAISATILWALKRVAS